MNACKNLILLLFIPFLAYSQGIKNERKYKKEGLEFALRVVKTFFEDDCLSFLNLCHCEIINLEGAGIINKKEIVDDACKAVSSALYSDSNKTYADYLADYKPQIFSKKVFEKKFRKIKIDYYTIQPDDLFFWGFEQKTQVENYIKPDMFIFMIRKVGGEWRLVGVG